MNLREPSQSFEAARRQHLIDATIEALADVGFKAASLSQIARRADVSTGLFAHYFGDKDGLLEATLRFMAARLVRGARQRLRSARTPRERLYAVPDSALADQEFERRTSAVWLAFWGQITHSTRYQRIQVLYQRRMLSNLRHDLRALVPPHCVEPYATIISSMIDGVWIRSHASPTQKDGAQARAIVRALIDGLIVGASEKSSRRDATPVVALPRGPFTSGSQRHIKPVIDPVAPGDLCGVASTREKDIGRAVDSARHALRIWHGMTAMERANALRRCGDAIGAESENLAGLDAQCTGRAVKQTLEFSVPRALQAFAASALAASRPASERAELGPGLFEHRRREPLGVVAGFGHWSAPLLDVCCQAATALAYGNAMIFQPSTQAPLTAMRVAEIFAETGMPPGLFAVLRGDLETADRLRAQVDAAACDPFDDCAPKPATIVFAGPSISDAATAVLRGYRRWTHVPDYSENRIFVHRAALADFRACLLARAELIGDGDPLAPGTQLGTLMSPLHRRQVLALVEQAVDAGAARLMGCGKPSDSDVSLRPIVLGDCHVDMELIRRRQFAPVIAMIVFADDDDIVRLISNDRSGVAVGIFDADVGHAHHVANRLNTHFCCINDVAVLAGDNDGAWASRLNPHASFGHTKRIFCHAARAAKPD